MKPIGISIKEEEITFAQLTELNEKLLEELNGRKEKTDTYLNMWPLRRVAKSRIQVPVVAGTQIALHRNRGKVFMLIHPEAYKILSAAQLVQIFGDIEIITDLKIWKEMCEPLGIE